MRLLNWAWLPWIMGCAVAAASPDRLPDPLTLPDALKFAGQEVPALISAQAAEMGAQATRLEADALNGLNVTATGRLRMIEPAYKSADTSRNDSSLGLLLQKRLYDFGYSDARDQSADAGMAGSRWQTLHAEQQTRLAVMRAFFDVILADLDFARDNEAMAIAYLRADRAQDRNELGQMSDVDLLQAEAESEEARRLRFASETRQLLTRSRLAMVMGRPGDLVSDLVSPQIVLPEQDAGSFQVFWDAVLQNNPELLALRAKKDAAMADLEAAKKRYGPVLSAELEASVRNRNTASTHPLGGGLLLEVPLSSGGQRDAAVARARAALLSQQAALREARLRLQQQARELWAARTTLRADIRAFQKQGDYRDLYLDRSRALYEMEVKTDLGDAMTRTSEVRRRLRGALFEWAINEATMQALTGKLLENES